jgi:hypothetical protein
MLDNFNQLSDLLTSDEPVSIIRFGNVEVTSLLGQGIYEQMYSNAGFYGDEKCYQYWKKLYIEALFKCNGILDVCSCASFQICGDLMIKLNCWKPTLPYIEDPSWWIQLIEEISEPIGVVSFFKKDIEEQIPNLSQIWVRRTLRKKKFNVVESWNTITGNKPHKDWNETFEKLKERVDSQTDTKLWLISCGCYGLPLCEYIRQKGGKAIYVGGLLQLIFGLKGSRWEDREEVTRHYNQYWKYPTTKPENYNSVEGGCYWEKPSEKKLI